MAAQYDGVAELYRRTKQSPLRRYVEAFSFMGRVGDVSGLRVLDLGCGEGFYTRRLKRAGATRVVGVDVSAEMIRLALERERAEPLGIEYLRGDAAEIDIGDRFDIVTGAYLLHYAHDVAELRAMARRIATHLVPHGRFVGLNENPEQTHSQFAGYDQYAFNKTADGPLVDGCPITYWFVAGRERFTITARYFSAATYESALRAAGFDRIAWRAPELDPAGITEYGADYWREYLDNPPVVTLTCRRGA